MYIYQYVCYILIDGIRCRRRLLVSGSPAQAMVVEESVLEGVRLLPLIVPLGI